MKLFLERIIFPNIHFYFTFYISFRYFTYLSHCLYATKIATPFAEVITKFANVFYMIGHV